MLALVHIFNRISKKSKTVFLTEELLLVAGSFMVYFAAHSVFWWKGLFNSYGLMRVIAAVMPCAALLALRAINDLTVISSKLKIIQNIILLLCPAWMAVFIFTVGHFSIKEIPDAELIDETTDWFKNTDYKNNIAAYMFPYLVYKLDRDPFDYSKVREIWGLEKADPSKFLPDGAIIFWDSHFAPNEGMLPFNKLIDNPSFTLLKRFKSLSKGIFLGGEFETDVFKKTPPDSANIIQNHKIFSELDSLYNTRLYKIKGYKYRMKHDDKWIKEIKHKAKERKISVDSMLSIDAEWLLKKEDTISK